MIRWRLWKFLQCKTRGNPEAVDDCLSTEHTRLCRTWRGNGQMLRFHWISFETSQRCTTQYTHRLKTARTACSHLHCRLLMHYLQTKVFGFWHLHWCLPMFHCALQPPPPQRWCVWPSGTGCPPCSSWGTLGRAAWLSQPERGRGTGRPSLQQWSKVCSCDPRTHKHTLFPNAAPNTRADYVAYANHAP